MAWASSPLSCRGLAACLTVTVAAVGLSERRASSAAGSLLMGALVVVTAWSVAMLPFDALRVVRLVPLPLSGCSRRARARGMAPTSRASRPISSRRSVLGSGARRRSTACNHSARLELLFHTEHMRQRSYTARGNLTEIQGPSDIAEDDRRRSRYVRRLIQEPGTRDARPVRSKLPRVLIQFWDSATTLPADVRECMVSWRRLEEQGFERLLFDDRTAGQFIAQHFGCRFSTAFARCRHPAMRCDYFRLCFMAKYGGFYVDADDVYQGGDSEYLFQDDRLKLQPLCYDISTATMVRAEVFTAGLSDSPDWIYYVNNNPIIAPPSHPVIRLALARSTRILLSRSEERPDIQSITGPGNLTASLVRHAVASELEGRERDFAILPDWDAISVSRWPLSYRCDERNWRLWSCSQQGPEP